MIEDVEKIAAEASRKAAMRQLRRDMRYLARVMRRHEAANVHEPGVWRSTYSYVKDAERRLGARYGRDCVHRMKLVVHRTYKLRSYV